jgi:hypothetical protein
MKFISIFDYNWGRIWQFAYPQEAIDEIIKNEPELDESEAFEQWITDKGFDVNDLHYMFHADNKLYTEKDL